MYSVRIGFNALTGREIFTATDFNTDGSISVDEFKALAASQSDSALSMQEAVFGMVDADANGTRRRRRQHAQLHAA